MITDCAGYKSLLKAVEKDTKGINGQGCFNPNGCDHEFYRRVEGGTRRVSKCTHKYCDKFRGLLNVPSIMRKRLVCLSVTYWMPGKKVGTTSGI